jgi:hypothetical protein
MTDINQQQYSRKVMTRNGFTLMFPNVGSMDELYQDSPPNPFEESATQLFPLGTKLIRGEQVWRYCKAGGVALNIAAPVQQAKAAHAEQDDDIVVGAAAAKGATSVELTSTANLDGSPNDEDDDFKDGYLVVNDEAGQGQLLKIKSNEGFSTTDDSTFTLYDPLTVALTTSSQVGLVRNPYYKVIATEAVVSGMVIGVPQIAVTAAYYFWCQTGGPAAVVAHAAVALGTAVVVGTTAAKADPAAAATTELIIGYPMTPGVSDTESFIVFLTLDR